METKDATSVSPTFALGNKRPDAPASKRPRLLDHDPLNRPKESPRPSESSHDKPSGDESSHDKPSDDESSGADNGINTDESSDDESPSVVTVSEVCFRCGRADKNAYKNALHYGWEPWWCDRCSGFETLPL